MTWKEGYRIVDLCELAKQMYCKQCRSVIDLNRTMHEKQIGFASVLSIVCILCGTLNKVHTSQRQFIDGGEPAYHINITATTSIKKNRMSVKKLNKFFSDLLIPSQPDMRKLLASSAYAMDKVKPDLSTHAAKTLSSEELSQTEVNDTSPTGAWSHQDSQDDEEVPSPLSAVSEQEDERRKSGLLKLQCKWNVFSEEEMDTDVIYLAEDLTQSTQQKQNTTEASMDTKQTLDQTQPPNSPPPTDQGGDTATNRENCLNQFMPQIKRKVDGNASLRTKRPRSGHKRKRAAQSKKVEISPVTQPEVQPDLSPDSKGAGPQNHFVCTLCNFSFSRFMSLYRHQIRKHGSEFAKVQKEILFREISNGEINLDKEEEAAQKTNREAEVECDSKERNRETKGEDCKKEKEAAQKMNREAEVECDGNERYRERKDENCENTARENLQDLIDPTSLLMNSDENAEHSKKVDDSPVKLCLAAPAASNMLVETFQCKQCLEKFQFNSELKRHIVKHTNAKPYCCSVCGKSFSHAARLNRHKRKHTGEMPYSCGKCSQKFQTLYCLKNHLKKHTEGKLKCCPRINLKCGLTEFDKRNWKSMAKECDVSTVGPVIEVSDVSTVDCVTEECDVSTVDCVTEECDVSTVNHVTEGSVSTVDHVTEVSDVSAVDHVTEVSDVSVVDHVTEGSVSTVDHVTEVSDVSAVDHVTEECDISAVDHVTEERDVSAVDHVTEELDVSAVDHVTEVSDVSMVNHVTDKPDEESTTPNPYNSMDYRVPISGDTSTSENDDSGKLTYQCEECSIVFPCTRSFAQHMKSWHPDVTDIYQCSHCKSTFKYMKEYTKHLMKMHHIRPYSCSQCGLTFKHISSLQAHQLRHVGLRQFMCETCGHTYKRVGDLRRHERTHTNDRAYICKICGKSFLQYTHLVCHQRTHTGERPFVCEKCGKNFSQQASLYLHMKTHREGMGKIECERCGKWLANQRSLDRHQGSCTGVYKQRFGNFRDFICEKCGKDCKYRQGINYHRKVGCKVPAESKDTQEPVSTDIKESEDK